MVDHVIDHAAHEVADGRPGAAIGHEVRREAELRVEDKARHVGDRANPGVAVGELGIVGLEVVDELFQGFRRGVFLGHDCLRRVVDDAHLREALRRIVFEIRIERGRRRLRPHIADRDGVAVGLRLGRADHAQGPAGAADVLDHERLAERARHMIADKAGYDIGRSARRERHDHGDRLIRILGGGWCAVQRERKKATGDQTAHERHSLPPWTQTRR